VSFLILGIGSTPGAGAEASRTSRLEDILSADAVIATGILNDPAGERETDRMTLYNVYLPASDPHSI
jgi:hypothetical protein